MGKFKHQKNSKSRTLKGKSDSTKDQTKQDAALDTVFIRNLSFDTEEDSLKKFIENSFGETVYCLICRDKETDESKGTAFAKFKEPSNARKCLDEFKDRELQTKFHLDGRNLIVLPAMSREKLQESRSNADKTKDKRNLALAREGFIKPQSEEAEEISKSDMEKRKTLDVRKKELLKNLHNFVSDTRLCIHNLPASVDDNRLRQIFLESIKGEHPQAKIVECRVMRNKKGSGQLGTSKGFGFVAFSKHEHALASLRSLNNNPKIFSNERRPIVEFSIENMVALNKKKTRLANSQRKIKEKLNNPQKDKKGDAKKKDLKKKVFKSKKPKVDTTDEEDNLLKKMKKIINKKLKDESSD